MGETSENQFSDNDLVGKQDYQIPMIESNPQEWADSAGKRHQSEWSPLFHPGVYLIARTDNQTRRFGV